VSGVDGSEFGDRRRAASHLSPSELLDRFPARLLMERLSIPMIAVNVAGDIMIANGAFAELVGSPPEVVLSLKCADHFRDLGDGNVLSFIRTRADGFVELHHAEGGTVYAKLTQSVLRRDGEASPTCQSRVI
jgi:PAS domain-containing protein